MNVRFAVFAIVVLGFYSCPSLAFCSTATTEKNNPRMYISLQYQGDFWNNFKIEGVSANDTSLHGYDKLYRLAISPDVLTHPYDAEFQSANGFAGSLGYQVSDDLRFELEVQYSYAREEKFYVISGAKRNDLMIAVAKSDIEVLPNGLYFRGEDKYRKMAALIDAFYDFRIDGTDFIPYFGVGVGLGHLKVLDEGHYNFAYQLKLGLAYEFKQRLRIFTAYKYFGFYDKKHSFEAVNAANIAAKDKSATFKIDASAAGLELGLLYKF